MSSKTIVLALSALLLFAGTAFADSDHENQTKDSGNYSEEDYRRDHDQDYDDGRPDGHPDYDERRNYYEERYQECQDEYEESRRDAEEDYREAIEDYEAEQRERDGTAANSDGNDTSKQDLQKEERRYYESMAEANKEFEECRRDVDEERYEEFSEYEKVYGRDHVDYDDYDIHQYYEGFHVAMELTIEGIERYSVDGNQIFDRIGFDESAGWHSTGSDGREGNSGANYKIFGESAGAKVSDTETGVLVFRSNQTFSVIIADGVEISEAQRGNPSATGEAERRTILILEGDDFTARLFLPADHERDGNTIETSGKMRMAVTDGEHIDRKHENRETVDAIADGRIAVEVEVDADGQHRGAEHDDVNVTVIATSTGLVATVDSEGDGRTVLFNVDPEVFTDPSSLQVIFDGEVITLADDLADVLDISDGVPEYLILVGAAHTEVYVQVPHFSPHTIELTGAVSDVTVAPEVGNIALAIGAAAAATFVAITLIARRRR